jgi:hypothetical protein
LIPSVVPSIQRLPVLKKQTGEMGLGDPVEEIGRFIATELDRHGQAFSGQGRPDLLKGDKARETLNEIFQGNCSFEIEFSVFSSKVCSGLWINL